MISHFFIDRPIFASVLSIIIVVVGLVSLQKLPVAQFPQITPPVVQIDADYPGASAEVVADSVARPIEVQLPGIDNLLYYESTSTNDGHMTMKLTFEIGTNVDIAQVQTQNRQRLAEPQLPPEVVRQGVTVKKMSPDLLAIISLNSINPEHDNIFLSNFALIRVLDNIKRLPGVGDAIIFGGQNYTMRIILDPARMAQFGLIPSDVTAVVREQNRDFPSGRVGREPSPQGTQLTIPVITTGRMSEVSEFEDMIIRAYPDGSMVRLKDIAKIELGAQSYDLEGRLSGEPTTMILTYLAPEGNALNTVRLIRQEMEKLTKIFPPGVTHGMIYDTTTYVEVSIKEVVITLLEATLLVILVVFIFLQSWRATLIPAVAVPISLIGTFAGMYALGFSVNTLTLFGMVLSIGIVVDDAIVVVENVDRHIRQGGLSPKAAAKKAMTEVTGPVIAIVLVLTAVFVPVAFLGGITGELYKQFAITIAVSVAISGVVALTLSPALCALVLKPDQGTENRFWQWFNRLFERIQNGYVHVADGVLKRSVLAVMVFSVLIFLIMGLARTIPTSFLPDEDQGYFITIVQLPDGASMERMLEVVEELEDYFLAIPAVYSIDALTGQDSVFGTRATNRATMFIILQPWDQRKKADEHALRLLAGSFKKFADIPEAKVLAFNAPSIRGLGSTGGFSMQLQDPTGGDFADFAAVTQEFIEKAQKHPEIAVASSNFRVSSPRLFAEIDRERAKALGIPISDVFDTMQAYFGNFYINDFIKFGRIFRVQTEAMPEDRASPDDISKIYIRTGSESEHAMVPLDSVVTTRFNSGPDPVTHFNGYNSALVLGSAASGYSSGQAMAALEELANQILIPKGYAFDWSAISFQEHHAQGQSVEIFAFALLMVFLVLAALYESWSVPFAVIFAIPFGVLGAMLAIWTRGLTNDIYFQIGLITLIGLAAKNAILIVEFAQERYVSGASLREAALEAARLRFRPIIMTSMAFILGTLPLVIASGAGAASRHSIGTGVFGGMLAATFLAIFFVPFFFVLIGQISHRIRPLVTPSAEIKQNTVITTVAETEREEQKKDGF